MALRWASFFLVVDGGDYINQVLCWLVYCQLCGIRNEVDPAHALLSVLYSLIKYIYAYGAILGLGIAYAGQTFHYSHTMTNLRQCRDMGITALSWILHTFSIWAWFALFRAPKATEAVMLTLEVLMNPKINGYHYGRYLWLMRTDKAAKEKKRKKIFLLLKLFAFCGIALIAMGVKILVPRWLSVSFGNLLRYCEPCIRVPYPWLWV
ncbi:hypothetical protein CVS40_11470 [Lucilia cuprina]|nr:hypothetical protein CVS40_11470 [Lucilia cuprina]